ncbi:zinc finger protein 235-like isoform X2 [Sparus aurata]|uniref:zinc finger protein 235-like isoform X2 n=1 Tax=Sparus aurata TaxID=8175 RepID=UPI0011C16179|nr:zinc finger protein 235-like isoform X2 [Sparus aurata]
MLSLETFENQVSAVMDTLVKAAVTELGTLLDKCSANAMAARQRSAPAPVTPLETEKEEESEATAPEGRRQFNEAITTQFASLMAAWAKGAVEKMLMILKVSMCEAEDVPAAEQRLSYKTKQVVGSKKPDAATHETNSGSPELASDVSEEDVVQNDADALSATSKIKKKKTTGPFKCPSCDKSFALKCLMDRHYLTHSKPHLCSECGKRFSGLRGLAAHSRRHTGEKLYKCSDCGTEFAYKSTFKRHMHQHSLQKPITHVCKLCENQFTGLLPLQRHRCCALKKTFVCSLCPETFECRQSLADHENLHSGEKDFVCEMCGESFFSSPSLATHRVTHTQKENCCDVLGFGSSDSSVLRNHMSKHTGEKLFSCEVCGKGCSHQSALKHHMLTHTGERPYICETCGKRCGHASALQNHMRIHTGKKRGQKPVCDVCGKKFRCMVNLKYHMSVHTGERPYACDQCDKKFSNPSNLKLHTMIHLGKKMYGCNICGKRFTQSTSLKVHRRIHTGERPYRCMVCGKGFMYCSEFRKHERSHLPDGHGPSERTAVKI